MRTRSLLLALFAVSCVRNPATGKLELDLIPSSQEIQMGQDEKKQVEQQLGLYDDPKLAAYVSGVGQKIAAVTGTTFKFSYEIVEDASVNAFALPGGPIFVNRGLLGYVTSEAELAAVLGHESGHVAAHHSANQLSKQELAQVGLGLGAALSPAVGALGQVASAGLQVLFLKYSRDDETQADELGFRFMTRAGYDPHQMIPLFQMLDGVGKQAGGGMTPQWLETHPDPGNRLQATLDRIKNELKGDTSKLVVNRNQYLKEIDGLVFGEDPRQGFFKGDTFVEPALKWQLQFPAGWQHQNTPQAVTAQSPKQDAVLQVSSAGKVAPEQAAQQVFSQQGVHPGQPVSVHGAKVASSFTAQGQQGAIEGVAAFIPFQGNTYMLIGYTGQGGMQGYGNTFLDAMGSFGELKDAAAAGVQPAKIHIVRVEAPLSIQEFNARYPSKVKLDLLALINGVEDGSQLQPGYAKQVVGGP